MPGTDPSPPGSPLEGETTVNFECIYVTTKLKCQRVVPKESSSVLAKHTVQSGAGTQGVLVETVTLEEKGGQSTS